MFALALWTGMRPGELVALDWEDVDLERATVMVRKSRDKTGLSPTKSRRPRRIALPAEAVAEFVRIRPAGAAPGAVWPAESATGYIHPTTLSKRWKRIYRDAGLSAQRTDALSAYILRHTAATNLRRAGAPMGAIQGHLGHVSEDTTRRYLRLEGADAAPYADLAAAIAVGQDGGRPP